MNSYNSIEEVEEKYRCLLMSEPESEVVEFKLAQNNFSKHDMGKYFSALSNEARLAHVDSAWLILGVNDPKKFRGTDKFIGGTQFKNEPEAMAKLKYQVSEQVNNSLSFLEVTEMLIRGKRVIFFGIPSALPNLPTTYADKAYGRTGESVDLLSPIEQKKLLTQYDHDWSQRIVPNASLNDLDSAAILKARDNFKEKNSKLRDEVDEWDDITFLNKAKVILDGKITNTAILLLGKPESAGKLAIGQGKISWILQDENSIPIDYEHFGVPFLLTLDEARGKIRNLNYRYMQGDTIFPTELRQYDDFVIRETLNNAVAHQDYELNGKINLVEQPNKLIISNMGEFLPKSVEEVIGRDAPSEEYRNPFLAEAMVGLNLIDTIGSGIKRMVTTQAKRLFPLPTFLIEKNPQGHDRVEVTIFGEVLDINYTRLLKERTDLSLIDIMLLDKVQKKVRIEKSDADGLRKKKLIEGRYPNIYVASQVAEVTETKKDYLDNAGLKNESYKALILRMLESFPHSSKSEIFDYLKDKMPEILTEDKQRKKVDNLLQQLSREKKIVATKQGRSSTWTINQ